MRLDYFSGFWKLQYMLLLSLEQLYGIKLNCFHPVVPIYHVFH